MTSSPRSSVAASTLRQRVWAWLRPVLVIVTAMALLASLFGTVFVSGAAWVFGAAALIVVFGLFVTRQRAGGPRQRAGLHWKSALPVFGVLLLAVFILGGQRGAPQIGAEPIIARRATYSFTRQAQTERWRFLAVALSFHVAWHALALAFLAEVSSPPPASSLGSSRPLRRGTI